MAVVAQAYSKQQAESVTAVKQSMIPLCPRAGRGAAGCWRCWMTSRISGCSVEGSGFTLSYLQRPR